MKSYDVMYRMAQQAVYNEKAFLLALREQKQIENDEVSQKYLKSIEMTGHIINSEPNMDLSKLAGHTQEMTDNYSRLRERAKQINLPEKQQDV